jgi:hypothetical protein
MSIQWGPVLLAAFLMELVLFAIAIPLFLSGAGRVLVYVVPQQRSLPLSLSPCGSDGGLTRSSSYTACSSAS